MFYKYIYPVLNNEFYLEDKSMVSVQQYILCLNNLFH